MPSIATSTASGAGARQRRRRPPARSAPSWGRRRAARPSRAASWRPRARPPRRPRRAPPRTTTRAIRPAPSPSATIMIASWRSSASSASPKRSSSSLSGATRTPLAPEHIRIAVSLVESCPSTEARSKERLTHTPSSRSAVSALSAASVCDEAEHRREARRDHAGALALRAQAHRARTAARPRGWRASRTRRSSGSPAGSRRRRRGAAARCACEDPLQHRVDGQVLADPAGRGERDLGRVDARARAPRRPGSWRRRRVRACRWRRSRSRSWRARRAARRGGSARG